MTYSLNEVEATAKRATRGAGYAWGLSEDAAKATRWVCQQGLDGVGELARLLERGFGMAAKDHTPTSLGGEWRADDALCPVMAGALLSDSAAVLESGPIVLHRLVHPVVLLAFVGNAARRVHCTIELECDGVKAMTDGTQVFLTDRLPDEAQHITVRFSNDAVRARTLATRADPDPDAWAILNRFAHRTYAPATEESRILGAGAGLSDND
ncbi:DUF3726 domain-containing protein [Shimia sp.]|uniref:DUF3726 domain-containing protein n=1 Tax=Shimia sp. TaxID=1954381 RepID=UPI0032983146